MTISDTRFEKQQEIPYHYVRSLYGDFAEICIISYQPFAPLFCNGETFRIGKRERVVDDVFGQFNLGICWGSNLKLPVVVRFLRIDPINKRVASDRITMEFVEDRQCCRHLVEDSIKQSEAIYFRQRTQDVVVDESHQTNSAAICLLAVGN